jgi:hypothetical protein
MLISARTSHQDSFFFEPRGISLHCDATQVTNGAAPGEAAPQRHCILLHGWNSPSWYMDDIRQAVRALPQAAGWHFWSVDYKTHLRSFADSARDIGAAMRNQPYDFSHTIFVGFSMGGLVARQMVADGFPCHALLTLPHRIREQRRGCRRIARHGALSRWSTRLRALNTNSADKACRSRYIFCVPYRDRWARKDK